MGCSRTCPHCSADAAFHRWQPRTVLSPVGPVTLTRAYYYCKHCHQGHCPCEDQLRLTGSDLTPAARELVALAGTLASFAEATEKVLPKLAGFRVAPSTVERTTETAGAELGRRAAAGEVFGAPRDWKWSTDAEGKTVAVIAADLTGVPMQTGAGHAAEGRRAAVVRMAPLEPTQPLPPGQVLPVRYLAGVTGGLAALGPAARAQGAQVGMDRAQRWIALSDGGSGIEDWLRGQFPRVEAVILDFYHAAEHLHAWTRACHPDDPAAATRMGRAWSHWLKHEGGATVLAALEALNPGRAAAARTAHAELLTYFRNQVHRMDYPKYRAKGWPIGSGAIEAACKLVVGQRLKGCGRRWSEAGADAVCHLRALFQSEKPQWDAFWAAAA